MEKTAAKKSFTMDMTKGSPLKTVLVFYVPVLFSALVHNVHVITSNIISGRFISREAFAAVGSTNSLNLIMVLFIFGLVNGAAVLVSRYFGSKDFKVLRVCIAHGFYIVGFVAVVFTLVAALVSRRVLVLMNIPPEILDMAHTFLLVTVLGYPLQIAAVYLSAVCRAVGDSKNVMIRSIVSTIVNLTLSLLFVLVFNMGVVGLAAASIFAHAVVLVMVVVAYVKHFPELHVKISDFKLRFRMIRHILGIGIPMGMQSGVTMIGLTTIQSAVNSLGTVYVAAFATASNIENMLIMPFMTLTVAASSFIAQNHGANRPDRIKKCSRQIFIIGLVYGAVMSVVFILFARYIALMYLDSSDVRALELVAYYARRAGPMLVLLCVLFTVRNYISAHGYAIFCAFGGIVEFLTRSAIAFLLVGYFGFTVIALSNPLSWIFTNALLIISYFAFVKKRVSAPLREATLRNE